MEDTSLKEQDKKDASLKDELANLKDEYSSFKVGFEYNYRIIIACFI